MTKADTNFKTLCKEILENGANTLNQNVRPKYADGTPSYTYFINQVVEKYDLSKGELPLLTLRPVAWKSAIKEILWIYQDQTSSLDVLEEKYGIHWWNEWEVDKTRTIGRRYGATVKRYDLMNRLLNDLKTMPYGRRNIINLYQYQDFEETDGLFPCAMETHWNARDGFLDMTLIQRSSDVAVANAINKIQYTALLMMVSRAVNLKPGVFCHFVQNAHIYDRHVKDVKELIERTGQKNSENIKFYIKPEKTDFYEFKIDDFVMENYEPQKPNFKFEMAI